MGCGAQVEMKRLTPALINSHEITTRVQEITRKILPDADLDTNGYLTMGSEDMAFMLEEIPGCYFFVGSANDQKGLRYGHHHPRFDFDEAALPRAAALLTAAVADFLK